MHEAPFEGGQRGRARKESEKERAIQQWRPHKKARQLLPLPPAAVPSIEAKRYTRCVPTDTAGASP